MGQSTGPAGGPSPQDGDSVRLSEEQVSNLSAVLHESLQHAVEQSELKVELPEILRRVAGRNLSRDDIDRLEDLESEIAESLLLGASVHLAGIEAEVKTARLPDTVQSELTGEIRYARDLIGAALVIEDQLESLVENDLSGVSRKEALRVIAEQLERSREFIIGAGGEFDASVLESPRAEEEDDDDDDRFSLDALREWRDSQARTEEPEQAEDEAASRWNPNESKVEELIYELRRGTISDEDLEILHQNAEEIAAALVSTAEDRLQSLAEWAAGAGLSPEPHLHMALLEAATYLGHYESIIDGELNLE